MKSEFLIHLVTSEESRELYRQKILKAKNPYGLPFLKFVLPDGQKVHIGRNPMRIETKHRIAGTWDFCRKNITSKLKKAIHEKDEKRQRFLVNCLNVVQADHRACNYLNRFSEKFESGKITFEEFNEKYKARLVSEE